MTPIEVLKMLIVKIDEADLNKCNYAIEASDIKAINEALLLYDVNGCFSDIELKATIVERIGIMALKNKMTSDFKKGFESGFYDCLHYIKHK